MQTRRRLYRAIPLSAILVFLTTDLVMAQEKEAVTAEFAYYAIDNIVLLFCAVFVFLMQPGFALLEAGLNPSKNTVHSRWRENHPSGSKRSLAAVDSA